MADPVTQTAGASVALSAATTLGTAQLVSGFFGVPYDLLVWGAIGGLIALIYTEPRQPPLRGVQLAFHALGRLFAASAMGGGLAGLVMPLLAANVSTLAAVGNVPQAPRAGALIVGIGTAFLPEIFKWVKARLATGGAT